MARRRLIIEPLEDRFAPASVTFAVIGDYGLAGQPESDVAALVHGWNPDLIITTGDNNYQTGSASTIDANVGQYYHDFISPYQGSFGAGAATNRFFPSLGHADWGFAYPNPTGDQPYLNYFTGLPGNGRYYTFTMGPVQFFSLDSDANEPDGTASDSAQAQWLQQQLAQSTALYKIVYDHDPPYSSSKDFANPPSRWPYQAWGATAVISGHAHAYERLSEDNNFPYFIDGLGGEPEISSFDALDPGSQVRYNADFGAMRVTANDSQIQFQFITRTGALIDSYTINAPTSSGISDPGFETPPLAARALQYNPAGSPWTFNGSAGVASNKSAFTSGNPSAPQGTQVAFLQGKGSTSQSVNLSAGNYTLSFSAAQRGNVQASFQTFQVLIDGKVVGTFNNLSGTSYTSLATAGFAVAAGSHTILFQATDLNGGDNTVFLDQVAVNAVPVSLADPGFETPPLAARAIQYNPTGSPWTFTRSAGVASNKSAFTSGNPSAPQGTQVAFLQALGSVSQSVLFSAGTFTISFSAAQRGNVQASSQTFQVLVDGTVISTFNSLTGTNYTTLVTSSFTVAAGAHTVTFQGTDLHGGDNTVFLDQIMINPL
jgi:tartrate-resistant acid phosphatase type 5